MNLADQLSTIEAFAEFPRPEIEMIAGCMRELRFAQGESVIEQGERARAAYLMLEGTLLVERRAPGSGSRLTLSYRERGVLFGLLSLIDGHPRMATCRALGPVRLAELPADDFNRLIGANTPIGTRFQHVVATALIRELRATNQRITEVAALPEVDAEVLLTTLGQWD